MEEFRYKNNELWCEETRLSDVAVVHGTPLYVYSKRSVVDHCRHIERAFGSDDHLSCYAVKANANREVLKLLAGEGIGADVGSLGELRRALDAGFTPGKITFSGVGKRDDEIEFALGKNIMSLNAESKEEIEVIEQTAARLETRARILLRVNFDIKSDTHPYITTGQKHNKFGIERSKALPLLRWACSLPHLDVVGIHSHIGSQITDAMTFAAAADEMVSLFQEARAAGIHLTQLNFGGGFGVQYRGYVTHPLLPVEDGHAESALTTVKLLEVALPILRKTGCKILIQPGRSIIAHAGILLTNVLYTKENEGKSFVIMDAGMNDLIRPSLYQSYHQIVPLNVSKTEPSRVDIVGPLCESGDFFALDRLMPDVRRGDCLAVMCAGAYGYVLSSNYNGRPRPAEVLIDGDRHILVSPRESIDDI